MKKSEELIITRLITELEKIKDPRRQWGNLRHRLVDILVITLLAIICGSEKWEDIEDFGKSKHWLKDYLELPNGIPDEDTFRRVFEQIKPEELERSYRDWVMPYIGGCLGKQINVDGKTVCGASSRDNEAGSNLHIVSAWVREDGITMGQMKVDGKSNEITAIPKLLETLDISGSVVSIDAMGCQWAIAQKIIGKSANYLLAVKMNQPTMFQEIEEYFRWAREDPIEKKQLAKYELPEKSHGRICTRRVTVTTDIQWFESKQDWPYLRTFVMAEGITKMKDKTTVEKRYYISSLQAPAERFYTLVRGHWSIENQLHWVLDTAFSEDDSLIRKNHAPENLSVVRKIALALLKKDSSRKASIRRKQKIAGWDDNYLKSLFT